MDYVYMMLLNSCIVINFTDFCKSFCFCGKEVNEPIPHSAAENAKQTKTTNRA